MSEVQNQNESKEAKKFAMNLRKLTAIVKGEANLIPSRKVQADVVDSLVEELFAEEREKNREDLKKALKDILEKYAAFQKEYKAKVKELEKLKESKMEDFNKACSLVFERVSDIGSIESAYYQGINQAVGRPESGEEPVQTTEEP